MENNRSGDYFIQDGKIIMKIAIMAPWNTDSGPAIHAELIGRKLIEKGYEVIVFSFFKHSTHGSFFLGEDEDYVIRCFSRWDATPPYLDPRPFLINNYDIFIAEDIGMYPLDDFAKIFRFIKNKAKTINVIHSNFLPDKASFYQFDFDELVCFDDRYLQFLKDVFLEDKIHIIPYPCIPYTPGNKQEARKKLNLPDNKYIIFNFGHNAIRNLIPLLPSIEKLKDEYSILILVVTKKDLNMIKDCKTSCELIVREEAPEIKRLYDYLYASDLLIYNKPEGKGAITSSTSFQTLGAGCPIVSSKSGYIYGLEKVVFSFENENEFLDAVKNIFNKTEKYFEWEKNLKEYLLKNSDEAITDKFIELFNKMLNASYTHI